MTTKIEPKHLHQMKRIFFGLAVAASTLFATLPAQAQWAQTCTRDFNSSVNIRRGPSRSADVVASVPSNEYVRIMRWVWGGDGMRWYQVEYGGIVGYSRGDYLCR